MLFRRRMIFPGIVATSMLVATALHAGEETSAPAAADHTNVTATVDVKPDAPRPPGEWQVKTDADYPARAMIRALIEKETATTGLPADIAEAVVFVESRYDSSVVGTVGEVGAMQVRPETAAMLGFRGTAAELAEPEINVHYGVIYLSKAWRLAQGDLCRALMKYRAGHGEETLTARSAIYCNRARNRLIVMNSPFAVPGAIASLPPEPMPVSTTAVVTPVKKSEVRKSDPVASRPDQSVYAVYKQGSVAASKAFWAAHEARVRAINAQLESRWHHVASR